MEKRSIEMVESSTSGRQIIVDVKTEDERDNYSDLVEEKEPKI